MGTLSLNDFEDVSISVPWGHISGRWYGNRKDRPILALHGLEDNLGTFDRLIPLMPDYLGVLCIDLPGHGHSSRLPLGICYDFVDWVFVIGRIMKELQWSKVSLMGHSFGGILSLIHTSLAPHTVDLVIAIDGIVYSMEGPFVSERRAQRIEKFLEADERNAQASIYEPSSYTLDNLSSFVSRATAKSVPKELAPHVLSRGISRSQLFPDKFFVSKDNRVKYCNELFFYPQLATELALRIKHKPYLIIKGAQSPYIGAKDEQVISILCDQNPDFEFYEVSGQHHLHLSNAAEVAKHIVPFLRRHRPPPEEGIGQGLEQELTLRKQHKL